MDVWRTPNGKPLTLAQIFDEIRAHVTNEGKIYIGTDSFVDKDRCAFATAICLHGASGQRGGKYFFRKVFDKRQNFPSLVQRILREVQDSIEIGMNNGTSKISDMVTGYAKASGFDCKIKPDAWASQSVADKHSK